MKKIRGFCIKHRITTLVRRVCRRKHSPAAYLRLNPLPASNPKPISKILNWGQRIKTKAKAICFNKTGRVPGSDYVPLGQDLIMEKLAEVPKGHMAVYVGQKDGDFSRVLVPVIYFNHPLFGQLLKEAEEEYGFNHPGGITIPCRISEFERVKTRVAACRKKLTWN